MKRTLLAVLVIAALPLAAQAADLSYNYAQAGYDYSNNNSGPNAHGWNGAGSVAVGQNFQVIGGAATSNRDGSDTTLRSWNLGAGFHTAVSPNTDFVADVAYHQATVQHQSGDVKTYTGEVGVRSALAPHFEGWATVGVSNGRNDINNISRSSKTEAFGTIGGQYKFNKNWGLVAEGEVSRNHQGILVGPRFSF